MNSTALKRALVAAPLLALSLAVHADGRGGHGGGHYGGHGGHGFEGHGGHGHFRGSFGFYYDDPFWWGPRPWYSPYYYGPYAYDAPAVIVQQSPPVYVQRPMVAPPVAPAATSSWYYCPSPAGYYPYVQNCSQPWVAVDPQSVSPPR